MLNLIVKKHPKLESEEVIDIYAKKSNVIEEDMLKLSEWKKGNQHRIYLNRENIFNNYHTLNPHGGFEEFNVKQWRKNWFTIGYYDVIQKEFTMSDYGKNKYTLKQSKEKIILDDGKFILELKLL